MSDSPLITFLVPSHKEGDLIRLTCETILGELEKEGIEDFEIIVSDCNHPDDGGVEVGEALMRKEPRIRYVRQKACFNLGAHYSYGLVNARGQYFIMVPGDNEIMGEAIGNLIRSLGKADLVISYTANLEVRPFIRQLISKAYVRLCNFLFGLKLRYYTGLSMIKTELLRSLTPLSEGFAYSTEIIVRLLKLRDGYTYIEVPMTIYPPVADRKAAAFRLKNIISVSKTLARLTWDVRFK